MSPKKSSKSETPVTEESEIEVLKRQVAELLSGKSNETSFKQSDDIRPDKIVRLMNGYRGELNLPRLGGRPPLKFMGFGDIKNIQYSQLLEILEQKEDFLMRGWFYILDKEVLKKLGYQDLQLLTKEQIERVIDSTCPTDSAFELYQTGSDSQKATIIDYLISFVRDGKDVNQNLVHLIEKESKVKIVEKAEQAKEYIAIGVP